MPKYRDVLGTPSQRESDRQRIAVRTSKQSILCNEVERSTRLQHGLFVVDDDFHKKTLLLYVTKVEFVVLYIKDYFLIAE